MHRPQRVPRLAPATTPCAARPCPIPGSLASPITCPSPQALGPLAPLLARLSSQQPWASLLCVLGSLLTVQLAFLATPLMDCLLGRDLRNPSEVGRCQLAAPGCCMLAGAWPWSWPCMLPPQMPACIGPLPPILASLRPPLLVA